jgi:6-phosphogluconolactonase (cycloisomerase 2 family)
VAGSPFATGTTPVSLATDTSGQYLYIANQGSNNITEFSIDATTGFPTVITGSPISAGTAPLFLVPDPFMW